MAELLITAGCSDEADEGDEVHGKACSELPELILGVLVLGQDALCGGVLLFAEENRGCNARKDQAV